MVTIFAFTADRHWNQAGTGSAAVEQDRAGSALALAAAVLGSGQIEPIAQDREQRLFSRERSRASARH